MCLLVKFLIVSFLFGLANPQTEDLQRFDEILVQNYLMRDMGNERATISIPFRNAMVNVLQLIGGDTGWTKRSTQRQNCTTIDYE